MSELIRQQRDHCVAQWALVHLAAAWLFVCALGFVAIPSTLYAQRDARRDEWQRTPEVLAAMDVGEVGVVADIGAGRGYFTARLAELVGDRGHVFSVDIDDDALRRLRSRVQNDSLTNVDVIEGAVDDPLLPADSLDAILVVDSYHEMTQHAEMLAAMLRSLKPGGRLVMLDFQPSNPDASRGTQTSAHTIAVDVVEAELVEAGFEIVSREEDFTDASGNRGRRSQQWLLVARRPGQTGSDSDESGD